MAFSEYASLLTQFATTFTSQRETAQSQLPMRMMKEKRA